MDASYDYVHMNRRTSSPSALLSIEMKTLVSEEHCSNQDENNGNELVSLSTVALRFVKELKSILIAVLLYAYLVGSVFTSLRPLIYEHLGCDLVSLCYCYHLSIPSLRSLFLCFFLSLMFSAPR